MKSKLFTYGSWVLLFILTLTLLLISLYSSYDSNGTITFYKEEPTENTFIKQYVYVSGAVKTPGVYEIKEDMRVNDVIELAGGFDNPDQSYINEQLNLAGIVSDGDHIHIPPFVEQTTASIPSTSNTQGLVSINNASQSELETLSGVGPSTAQKIISGRPYNSLEDLLNVPGIGEKTFDKLQPYITL